MGDIGGIGAASQGLSSVFAATIQANAANHAADLTSKAAADSLGFQKDVFNTQQSNTAPWLASGKAALDQLNAGTAPGGSLVTPYGKTFSFDKFNAPAPFDGGPAFKAPTGADESNDPGYQFRLQQGQKALERSAAAKGTATGGAALKAAARYGQDYASNEYGNVYNRALQGYQTNFGNALNSYQANFGDAQSAYGTNYNTAAGIFNTGYNQYNTDQSNQFNRLAALAGVGQTAVGQLNSAGQAAAGNIAGINGNLGNTLGNLATQGGNAISAGVIGAGNAVNGGINNYQNNQILQGILNGSGYGKLPSTANGGIPSNGWYAPGGGGYLPGDSE